MAFLNITNSVRKGIVKTLDRTDYFKLSNPGTSRPELYNFALALGYKRGYPTEITEGKDALIREDYVNNARYIYSSLYYSEYVNQGHRDELDNLIYADHTFALADQFANTGFAVLKDLVETKPDSVLVFDLIREMDEMYLEIKKDLEKQE